MICIVVQFGLATIPLRMSSSASGLTSDTTSGTSSSSRNALELSTTIAPSAANFGAHTLDVAPPAEKRSEEHTSELQSLMRISYAVSCLNNKNQKITHRTK